MLMGVTVFADRNVPERPLLLLRLFSPSPFLLCFTLFLRCFVAAAQRPAPNSISQYFNNKVTIKFIYFYRVLLCFYSVLTWSTVFGRVLSCYYRGLSRYYGGLTCFCRVSTVLCRVVSCFYGVFTCF